LENAQSYLYRLLDLLGRVLYIGAVSPLWRARRQYPLHGYLRLEGREKEGHVLSPKQRGR
jgi:hypothetical protein